MVRLTLENHFIWGDSHSSAQNSCNVELQGLCPDVKVVSLPWKLQWREAFEQKQSWLQNSHHRRQLAPWHPHSTPENDKYCIKPWELFVSHRTLCFPIWLFPFKLLTPVHFPPGLALLPYIYVFPSDFPTWPSFPSDWLSHLAFLPHCVELAEQPLAAVVLVLEDHVVLPNLQTEWIMVCQWSIDDMSCMYLGLVSNGHVGCYITDLAHLGGKL